MEPEWSGWFPNGADGSQMERMVPKWSGWFPNGADGSRRNRQISPERMDLRRRLLFDHGRLWVEPPGTQNVFLFLTRLRFPKLRI